MKFFCTLDKHSDDDITGDVVNPGDWFGKAWLIGYPLGNFSFFLVVEADTEADAIDELADNEKWGHVINLDESELRGSRNEETVDRAGNDSHPVDLDNITIRRAPKNLVYIDKSLPEGGLKPKDYYNHINS